jgi:hypothetical protein
MVGIADLLNKTSQALFTRKDTENIPEPTTRNVRSELREVKIGFNLSKSERRYPT